jgi:hypothetical protein
MSQKNMHERASTYHGPELLRLELALAQGLRGIKFRAGYSGRGRFVTEFADSITWLILLGNSILMQF